MPVSVDTKLEIKELELKSLFETIRAINANASESDLYKIYKFIIHSNPNILKLALYVLDEKWSCKTYFGTRYSYDKVPLDKQLIEVTEIGDHTKGIKHFDEFSRVVPIKHKTNVLAYVFTSGTDRGAEDEMLELDFIDALTNIIIVAIENKKLVRKEQKQQEYNKQLDIAKDVQGLLFPRELPYNKQLKVEASYLPHHTIGGDYYDFIKIDDDRFLLCIADVSGKGIPAAILMSNFQAGLRILSRQVTSLDTIVNELNTLIIQNSRGENFITAFFTLYNRKKERLEYINAGHNPPFVFFGKNVKRLETGTTILGGFSELPFLETGSLDNLNDFLLFCFTDGFIETYNEEGEEFGEEYLLTFIKKHLHLDQKELHLKLISELNKYKGKNVYIDDITLLSCKVLNG
jgi:sigma-B regulation protein RsbU (phosphoserine phosphatase)